MTLHMSSARPPPAPDIFSCILFPPFLPRESTLAPQGALGAPRPKVNIPIHRSGKKAQNRSRSSRLLSSPCQSQLDGATGAAPRPLSKLFRDLRSARASARLVMAGKRRRAALNARRVAARREADEVSSAAKRGRARRAQDAADAARAGTDKTQRPRGPAKGAAREMWYRRSGSGRRLWADYYAKQLAAVLETPAARAVFARTASDPLPTTFRLRRGLRDAGRAEVTAAVACGASPIAWADATLGVFFQAAPGLDRAALAKGGTAHGDVAAERLAKELPRRALAAQLCRQEVVSALPVAAMKVQRGARCLDLCASPGSKTMQLLEAVGSKGCVFANDADPRRARQLLDSLARHGRLGAKEAPRSADCRGRLIVTCHRGEAFPEGDHGHDNVLADVPCSGDGTSRKDASVLPRFSPKAANDLHPTQVAIAWRGLQLLKVGGLMAFSTCSLNPIEDEAVVAALLRHAKGIVSLEEWPEDVLPQFKRRSGLKAWGVSDATDGNDSSGEAIDGDSSSGDDDGVRLRWHATYAAAKKAGFRSACESMWPPSAAEAASMHLERCSRVLPADNDTGGFFVALLRKTGEIDDGERTEESVELAARGPSGTRELGALPEHEELMPVEMDEGNRVAVLRRKRDDGERFGGNLALMDYNFWGASAKLSVLAAGKGLRSDGEGAYEFV